MAIARSSNNFEVKPLPIIGKYNLQRFAQWNPEEVSNWYLVNNETAKRAYAMYPILGRAHINALGQNRLIFSNEPRLIYKSINYWYVVDNNTIFRIDAQYNQIDIAGEQLETIAGPVYASYMVVNSIVFVIFVDSQKIYIYQENTNNFYIVNDTNAPGNFTINNVTAKPGYVAVFGNRVVVSVANSSQFVLSQVNLGLGSSGTINPANCFTNSTGQIFAQEEGIIRQMGVLNNTLYIFCDYITGVWSNIASTLSNGVTFPWKKNTTYNWNFGIANSNSLSIEFGMIVFLAQNSAGLMQFMSSTGSQPESISDKSIDTLLQNYTDALGSNSPFLATESRGFLYQYENVIFYRFSGGDFQNYTLLNQDQNAVSLEYTFENQSWHKCIELNGERCRVQQHVYFNNLHLVTVNGDNTVYNMSGQYYYNEITNPAQDNPQSPNAYIAYPFRYERVTPIISEHDYSEFETDYVEIDFVFGSGNVNYSISPFQNAQFIIGEQAGSDGTSQYLISEQTDSDDQPVFVIADGTNNPSVSDTTYNYLSNPSIELLFSDNGGVSFDSADSLEFSQMGVYSWRMRWYELGASRNRVYKLICVSAVPIVVLGGVMNVRRISGGAN